MFQNVIVRDSWLKSAWTDVGGAFFVVLSVAPMGILEVFALMG